jgi:hypothetical protein
MALVMEAQFLAARKLARPLADDIRGRVMRLLRPRRTLANNDPILVALNKLSDQNCDRLIPQVLESLTEETAAPVAERVLDFAVRQPGFAQIFVRLFLEIAARYPSTADAADTFMAASANVVRTAGEVLKMVADPQSEYDAFCLALAGKKGLAARAVIAGLLRDAGAAADAAERLVGELSRSAEAAVRTGNEFAAEALVDALAACVGSGLRPAARRECARLLAGLPKSVPFKLRFKFESAAKKLN